MVARARVCAVEGEDVVAGDGAPVNIAIGVAHPPLNPGEQSFDAWTIALDGVSSVVDGVG